MTIGRKPLGPAAMTGAERQARHRARLAGIPVQPDPPARPKPPGAPSRQARWDAAIAILIAVRGEYAAWLDALPDALRDTPTGQALQAIADLDLEEIASVYLPKGYGRD
jgi:hypothetical protein